jgi:sporulation protein YlmC with PRC-barrel domain
MKQLKTLVFALLPLVLTPALAIAQYDDETRPGATQERTQPGAQQPGAKRPGEQPGAQRQPGDPGMERERHDPTARAEHERARVTGQAAIIQRQEMDQFRADNLIGSSVKNRQDEEIGQISDLLLDRDGNVKGLVVGVGGFLGVGDRDVALQWDAIELTTDEDGEPVARVDMDQQTLENAPEFERREEGRDTW